MPLTEFQAEVAHLLAGQRTPQSHVAGGAVINRGVDSLRFSADLDIFHDFADQLASSALADGEVLLNAGFEINWLQRGGGMYRAKLSRGIDQLHLDWAADSPFRFFSAQPDADFGYCLHPADLATNKVLALAGRTEIRDFLDILFIHQNYLSLGAVVWAACGKDQGFTPSLLLDQANCHTRFREDDLRSEQLARPVDLKELKRQWIGARTEAEALFERLPEEELGCLYLRGNDRPLTPVPESAEFRTLLRHFGSVHGAAPKFA